MGQSNSVDKIVQSYLRVVNTEPFTYKDKTYPVRNLRVSPGIFRELKCNTCGGCCAARFSLDYLPGTSVSKPSGLEPRYPVINGKSYQIYSDLQKENPTRFCKHLNKTEDGRGLCGIHKCNPFTCDFEVIRTTVRLNCDIDYLDTRLYGRGWAMLRADGERGAKCEILPPSRKGAEEALRKLLLLKRWAEHFEIPHCLNEITEWIRTGPHKEPLIIKKG